MKIDWRPFCKVLEITPEVESPTVVQLLGVREKSVTVQQLRDLCEQRKQLLRKNIPAPQFVPLVHAAERELDRLTEELITRLKAKRSGT